MEYRITLDGSVLDTDNVDGLHDLTIELERDPIFHGLLTNLPIDLTFLKAAYDTIYNAWETTPCGELTCYIEYLCPNGEYAELFDGVIFTNNVEFDLRNCTCTTEVIDNTFQAKIRNNRRIKAHVDADFSKNEVPITPASAITVSYFNPSTGAYSYTGKGWRVGDVFRYLIDFMTDDGIEFYSTLFEASYAETWYNLMLTTGYSLSNADGDAPYLSFEELFEEIDKRIPLSITLEDNAGTPRLRIEERSYAFDDSIIAGDFHLLGNFDRTNKGLTGRTDTARWYSKIIVGSETTQESESGTFTYPDVDFSNWKEEEYHVLGVCNTDNELELIGEFIVDSNVIEDVLVTPNDEYDDELFLVECMDSTPTVKAIAYDDIDPAGSERFYNKLLENEWIVKRYIEEIPNSLAQFISVSSQDNLFRAELSADDTNGGAHYLAGVVVPINADPYPFDLEIFDNGGNYNDATYRYTAPDGGFFRFNVGAQIKNVVPQNTGGGSFEFTIDIVHYDSGGTEIQRQSKEFVRTDFPSGLTEMLEFYSEGFYVNTADYVNVVLEARGVGGETYQFDIGASSYFECAWAFNGGGIVAAKDSADYRAKIYEFEFPLSVTEWNTLLTNKNGAVTFNQYGDHDNDTTAYIQRVTYEFDKGKATFELIQ